MLERLRRRRNEKGFTLIELLVVVIIIGLLAANAIPAFLGQRNKANDAAAKSLVRNGATAMEAYFSDGNTYVGALAGLPELSVPMGFSPHGMPLGLSFIGDVLADGIILRLGIEFQRETDWHLRRPTIVAA